ncbi:MAG: RNA-guided endonuclease TnpB family protein, partial [Hyphomicrobiaceae bacterium]
KVAMRSGPHQRRLLAAGEPREAELICRKGQWFFNLVIDIAVPPKPFNGIVVGVDVGEVKLAACSTGGLWGGEQLRHRRDGHLALRSRLPPDLIRGHGSESALQLLRKVSGKESRRVRHVNHEVSKAIVAEALSIGATLIALEDLTDIRSRISAGKRVRTRLHRWSFRQLQTFVAYKAAAAGIDSIFVDPAYTSKTCSACGRIGKRQRHRFVCLCGLRAHADLNASRNIARIPD